MIWFAALAQLTAPSPANAQWMSPEDSPERIMVENVVKNVRVGLTVAPNGRLENCRVEVSSGNLQLDRHTCDVLQRRAKFRPAKDAGGNNVYGIYRTTMNWWVGDGRPPSSPEVPDMEIHVSALPPQVKSPAFAYVIFAVDETGHPSDCQPAGKRVNPELAAMACEQLVKGYAAQPAKTSKGEPVSSVQSGAVLLKTK